MVLRRSLHLALCLPLCFRLLFPALRIGLGRLAFLALQGHRLGQLLQVVPGLLPVLPFDFACLKPGLGVVGQGVAGLAE